MKISQKPQFIEGLRLPRKLQFGNAEHIALRKRIACRKKILAEGIECWNCGGKMVYLRRDGQILFWRCNCGETLATDRDGSEEIFC